MTTGCDVAWVSAACRDAGDHVDLGAIDQLVRQAFEAIGHGSASGDCISRASAIFPGADQLDHLGDYPREEVVSLPQHLARQKRAASPAR